MNYRQLVFTIQEWMMTELKLSGNELLVYALIFQVSQDGESEYASGLKYISEKLNITVNTVHSTLTKLLEKGLVDKREIIVKKGKMCNYKAVLTLEQSEEVKANVEKKIKKDRETKIEKLNNGNNTILEKVLSQLEPFTIEIHNRIWDWADSINNYNELEYVTKKIILSQNALLSQLGALSKENNATILQSINNAIDKPEWGKIYIAKKSNFNNNYKAKEPNSRNKQEQEEFDDMRFVRDMIEITGCTKEQAEENLAQHKKSKEKFERERNND